MAQGQALSMLNLGKKNNFKDEMGFQEVILVNSR